MEDRSMNKTNSNTNINNNTHITVSDVPLVSFGDLVTPRKDRNNRRSDMSIYTENK